MNKNSPDSSTGQPATPSTGDDYVARMLANSPRNTSQQRFESGETQAIVGRINSGLAQAQAVRDARARETVRGANDGCVNNGLPNGGPSNTGDASVGPNGDRRGAYARKTI